MYNGGSQITRTNNDSRSSLNGNRANSGRNDQRYQRPPPFDGVSEGDENEYEETRGEVDDEETGKIVEPPRDEDPYIRALRYRFPNRSKKDYVYTRPNIASGISGSSQPPPAPPIGDFNGRKSRGYDSTSKANNSRRFSRDEPSQKITFPASRLRPVSEDEQHTNRRNFTDSPSERKQGPFKSTSRTNVMNNTGNDSPYRSNSRTQNVNDSEVTPNSWQYKKCVQECLEREKRRLAEASNINSEGDSRNINRERTNLTQEDRHQTFSHTTRPHSTIPPVHPVLDLNDIRYINVALSRSGIPLFPYENGNWCSAYPARSSTVERTFHPIGSHHIQTTRDVVSACRIADEEA